MVGRGTLGCFDYSECWPGPPAWAGPPAHEAAQDFRSGLEKVKAWQIACEHPSIVRAWAMANIESCGLWFIAAPAKAGPSLRSG